MARYCAGCRYYTEGEETACPTCHANLQFTLLPLSGPVTREPDRLPPPLARGPVAGPLYAGRGSFDLVDFCMKNRMLVGIFVVPLLLLGAMAFGLGQGVARQNFTAIQVGMTPEQVRAILIRKSGGGSMHKLSWVVTGDGEGRMEWSSGAATITILFQGGRAVSKSQTGLDPDA